VHVLVYVLVLVLVFVLDLAASSTSTSTYMSTRKISFLTGSPAEVTRGT
jgi:hypothetical protein